MPALSTPVCKFGWKAQNFSLKSTRNEIIELNKARGQNGTLIMFICIHCPYVVSALDDIIYEAKELIKNDIAVIAISSNDVSTHPEDSFENMKALSADKKLPFPYLYDETQEVAKAYDAACTPDFYLFDADLKLSYRGQLDDSRPENGIPVTGKDMRAALESTLNNETVAGLQKPSIGCNIKWKA